MDEQVRAALARWPDVPDCTGWLALDARGRWRIGEAKDGPRQPITHPAMLAFIDRNYEARGRCWMFQNGPQRVFVELEYTPYVWRVSIAGGTCELAAQNGDVKAPVPTSAWLDDEGRFLFEARREHGPAAIGVVHDHDTVLVADLLHDVDGVPLGDDALSDLSTDRRVAESATARLHWTTPTGTLALPLQRIASDRVAERFGFEPHPSLALRVDVDTRR